MKTRPQGTRFDHVWHDTIVVEYTEVGKYLRRVGKNVRELRRHIYRFAKGVLIMEKEYHNELLTMIQSEGKTVEEWMNEHFEMIEAMGDTRERIFAAIEAGVTEREYITEGEIVLARKRVKPSTTAKAAEDPIEIKPPASVQERARYFEEVAESYKSKWQALRAENRRLRDDLARTLRRVDELERATKRADKTLDSVLEKRDTLHETRVPSKDAHDEDTA